MKAVSVGVMVSAVLMVAMLLHGDVIPAYAEVTAVIRDAPGFADSDDCANPAGSYGVVWIACGTVLRAINVTTNVEMAIEVMPSAVGFDMLPTVGSGGDIGVVLPAVIANTGSQVLKYKLNATFNGIDLVSTYDPAGCTVQMYMSYDERGFVWQACQAADIVVRFNPNTMIEDFRSPDLTDGVAIDCGVPSRIAYSETDDFGVMYCNTGDKLVSFSIDDAPVGSINLADEQVTVADSVISSLHVDSKYNRVIATSNSVDGLFTFHYADGSGTILSGQTAVGTDYNWCSMNPAEGIDRLIFCAGASAEFSHLFLSGVDEVTQTGSFSHVGILPSSTGMDIQAIIFFVMDSSDNDDYLTVSGTFGELSEEPDEPGVTSEGDIDGDGIPNHADPDVDGDGVDNEADADIDGDGVLNEDDETPNGPVGLCDVGETAIDFAGDGSNVICVPVTPGGALDCSFGCNPLLGDRSPGIGIPNIIMAWGFTQLQANIMATIGLFALTFTFIIVPAWRFGYDPSPMMMFVFIMLNLSLATVLGWIDSLYFFAVIAALAVGGGLKFSGVL